MCLPILGGIIALTLFFGWAMTNQQHVKAAARYSAWRLVYGNWYIPGQVDPNDPNNADPNHAGLNELFFQNRADGIGLDGGSGPTDEFEQLAAKAAEQSAPAGDYARKLVLDTFPHAQRAVVSARFPSDVAAWQRFQGAIQSAPSHVRDGVEWRRRQADCRQAVREQFLLPLDDALLSVPSPGDGLGDMIRDLYLHGW